MAVPQQISRATTATRGQFLFALDDALNQHLKVRDKIDTKKWEGAWRAPGTATTSVGTSPSSSAWGSW
jgi:hypothetical protein